MFLNLKQQRFYLKSYERAYSNLNPWTETTCKHNRSHLPLIPAVGLALGARQILGHHERISMRVLGGISSPAQSHTQWGLCKMLASWDHCQTTNKWYYGILALPQRGAVASLYTTPAASFCHLHTHTHTFTLFIHQPGYVSWRVIAGLMCIHASWCVCVFTLSVGSVLSLPTLKPPSAPVFFLLPPPYPPPSLFPPLCAPIKDDWDLSKPSFLMSGLSIFFKGKNPVSFDNLALAEMSKQVEAEIKCMCNLKYIFCIQCFPALKHY